MTGLRLQDPGQYGPEPSRPHRLPARFCSGKLSARHEGASWCAPASRSSLSAPQFFFASVSARSPTTAFAGDVVGIPNHGTLRIGDTLTEGEDILSSSGVPNFAPEILRRVRLDDAMKAKKLQAKRCSRWPKKASCSFSSPDDGSPAIVGVVGALQLDVLTERLKVEYSLPVGFRNVALLGLPVDYCGRSGRTRPLHCISSRRHCA
ncbi:MAG: hypothetical protein P0Y54_10735 [Candidatus Ochrobactrum gambitense]|nr:MAG: hypothetical protein P0Y54_10735 [Candidatus Ochrobactrum gambitense]